MERLEQQHLCREWGVSGEHQVSLLQDGENTTYLVTDGHRRLVIRRYRQGRFQGAEIGAELTWLQELGSRVRVPEVIPTMNGDRFSTYENRYYAAFGFVEGKLVEAPADADYHRMGQLMRSLHEAADEIMSQRPESWSGWQRPYYDRSRLVDIPSADLLQSEHVSEGDRSRVQAIAEHLSAEMASYRRPVFVHNDLHFGNLLHTAEGDVVMDFDESGFGPRGLDYGVVRLHMLAKGDLDKMWPTFVAGYGEEISSREARVGTALRVFWMAGKILHRSDVVPDPERRIPRYLNWIESELSDLGQ